MRIGTIVASMKGNLREITLHKTHQINPFIEEYVVGPDYGNSRVCNVINIY